MLPMSTILGKLRIIEIYEFYNTPVLFACKNKTGHVFLVVWLDETDAADVWLYTPISPSRFTMVRRGEIDLHEAFMQPEDEIALQVTVYKDLSRMADITLIPANDLNPDWAPARGEYLKIPEELPRIAWEDVDQRNLTTMRTFDEHLVMAVSS